MTRSSTPYRKDAAAKCILKFAMTLRDSGNTFAAESIENAVNELLSETPAIPEGWKLVPKEPRSLMLYAATHNYDVDEVEAEGIYLAMLAAAPQSVGEEKQR